MLEPPQRGGQMDQTAVYAQARPRTTSSSFYPPHGQAAEQAHLAYYPQSYHGQQQPHHHHHPHSHHPPTSPAGRHSYTAAASSPQAPAAYRDSSSFDLRRSTSSRSFGPPQSSGYVALLRKQKATVWCDRAQFEDPRVAAQQRAAKMRAALEVSEAVAPYGSVSAAGGRTSTGLSSHVKVTSKITGRHHVKAPIVGYAGENHVGVGGVPMRLSATEVEAESSEDEDNHYGARVQHQRTGSSGRSSVISNRRNMARRTSTGGAGSQKGGIGGMGGVVGGFGGVGTMRRFGPGDTPERPGSLSSTIDCPPTPLRDDSASAASAISGRAMSAGSGSSVERTDNLGELGAPTRLASKSLMHSNLVKEKAAAKGADELKRRGSVDDRTSTLTSGRLFIANPD